MNEDYAAKHTENASDLYALRQHWLNDTEIHASAFESVEARLNVSIFLIAGTLQSDTTESALAAAEELKEPSTEAECFVFLASHINSAKPAKNSAGYALAYQWLSLDPAKSTAAEAALSLYPEADTRQLLKHYDEQETLRPRLMRLFRKQMKILPQALLQGAASDKASSTELKTEALHYAAVHPDIGLDLFRSHYVPLLSGNSQFDANLIAAALWGGLVRGDAEAHTALAAALGHTSNAQDLAPLLRLAALSGSPDFLPLLLQTAESDPDSGTPLLVLYGQKSVIPELLKALAVAHTMAQAASVFEQLTDYTLPLIPRLTLVGATSDDEEAPPEPIPDIKAAHTWWQHNQSRWKADERWLAGQPTTPAHLTHLTQKHAGQFGCDLMALLALGQQTPLNIPWEIWRARQQQLLAAHTTASKPAAKAPAQPKPTSARHA